MSTPTASTPATTSPRQSSEESYDVVSSQISRTASAVDVAGVKEPLPIQEKAITPPENEDEDEEEEDDEGADSDWE